MSKFIISYCVEPLYVIDDIEKARTCGYSTGLVYCTILTIIFGLIIIRHLYKHDSQYIYTPKPVLVVLLSAIILCWIFIPLFIRSFYGNMWSGYNAYIQDFINQGFTRQQAIA